MKLLTLQMLGFASVNYHMIVNCKQLKFLDCYVQKQDINFSFSFSFSFPAGVWTQVTWHELESDSSHKFDDFRLDLTIL